MADAIKKFWNWWPSIRPRLEAAIDGAGFEQTLVKEVNNRVLAIRDGLDWELAPGTTSKHAFCLSAKGDPEGRLVTEMWKARGPAADETWEFHGARRSGPGRLTQQLDIEGQKFKLEDFTVAMEVNQTRERVHGTYFHPAFARIENEKLRFTATYLSLDGILGEDEVERWLGVIETSRMPPTNDRPISELLAAVDELRKTATGEKIVLCQGEERGKPAYAVVNLALKRVDHLLACMHGTVTMEILQPSPDGLPSDAENVQLDALEADVVKTLGTSVVFFGRETKQGHRILHFFANEDSSAMSVLEKWQKGDKGRKVEVAWERDPTWNVQRRFG